MWGPMPRAKFRGFGRFLAVGLLTALVAACGSIGPRTMDRDQLDYGDSIGNNWKNFIVYHLRNCFKENDIRH